MTIIEAVIYIAVVCWLAGLSLALITLSERTNLADDASDTADRALAASDDTSDRLRAVVAHLTHTETATGRHARVVAPPTEEIPL